MHRALCAAFYRQVLTLLVFTVFLIMTMRLLAPLTEKETEAWPGSGAAEVPTAGSWQGRGSRPAVQRGPGTCCQGKVRQHIHTAST